MRCPPRFRPLPALLHALVFWVALGLASLAAAAEAPAGSDGPPPEAAVGGGAAGAEEQLGGRSTVPIGPVVGLTGEDPEALADRAVSTWLDQSPSSFAELSALDTEALCRELPVLLTAPSPPAGTEVDLVDRRERETGDADRRRYTYAAEVPPDRLDVVEAVLVRDGDGWRVDRVGFQLPPGEGRSWLQSTPGAIAFVGFTLLVMLALARPSPLRRWLAAGVAAIREHRRLVTWTFALGWGIVALGLWTGSRLPDACEQAVLVVLGSTLEQVGATQAVASGNLARAALVIFYQNYVMVTITALFGSALLLGVPAYLLAGFSFLAQTTAFGLLGLGGFPEIVLIVILFLIEFTSYFLIVAGGGMLVATLARQGLAGLGEAYTKLTLMLPIAGVLLLIGAWYEAVVVVGF